MRRDADEVTKLDFSIQHPSDKERKKKEKEKKKEGVGVAGKGRVWGGGGEEKERKKGIHQRLPTDRLPSSLGPNEPRVLVKMLQQINF